MTTNEFDFTIKWRSGMKIAVDNVQTDIISVDFHTRKIAIEEDNELIWISSDLITLKIRTMIIAVDFDGTLSMGPYPK